MIKFIFFLFSFYFFLKTENLVHYLAKKIFYKKNRAVLKKNWKRLKGESGNEVLWGFSFIYIFFKNYDEPS